MAKARSLCHVPDPQQQEDSHIFFAKMTCLIGAKEETTSMCCRVIGKMCTGALHESCVGHWLIYGGILLLNPYLKKCGVIKSPELIIFSTSVNNFLGMEEEQRRRHRTNRAAIQRIRMEVLRSLQSPSPPQYEDPPSYPEALKCSTIRRQ